MSDERRPHDEAEPGDSTFDGAGENTAEDQPKENPWAALKPWQGKATGLDKLLLFIIIGVPLVYLSLMPARPWMLVNAPVLQEFINGAKTAVVAAGAYARIGEIPLWLVIVAGFIGMAKLDWAFWLAGRRWGDGVLRLFAQNERQLKRINQLKQIPTWALFLMTLVSRCPGVPGTLVYIVAGWTRMRLSLFLIADLIGCLLFTLIWTFLGYQLGEAAVDVLKVVDKYALWLTLAIVVGIFVLAYVKEYRKQRNAQEPAED
ncbi:MULTISPECIES: DedA family protein [unclassified Brevibacterium]|uniref:DedA family protein n=1 Tax=unclassified Brevibacterium TaxID=2614124 RepID=UPI001E57AE2B|nr:MULTISPECIES: DedA family protein [unclassified Brevibacterium]MCD1285281.1 DedA family protein [Brevibacterium sp. CCUG 69071]MDK8434326.1 DedA family protein [Brevibacterium sp. H-BE7]